LAIGCRPISAQTIGSEDTRRERMDLGLGVWTAKTRRYYPLQRIRAAKNGILDEIDGETLFVYYDPEAAAPDALYVTASYATAAAAGIHV
jgi:hypothetical protein